MVKGLNVGQSSLRPITVWALGLAVKTAEWVPSFTRVWSLYGLCGYENWPISEALVALCVQLWTLRWCRVETVHVQDQLVVRSKLMNIQLLHSRPVNSCKSVHISQGLISVQFFQLIHASSCCADSFGVRFVGICAQIHTGINAGNIAD